MAGVISTGSHPKLLWPGLAALFGTTYNDLPGVADKVFDVRESDKAYEEIQELYGFGPGSVKTEGAGIVYTSTNQGPTSRFTNVTYGLGFQETEESVDDNQYKGRATDRTIALARSMRHTRETIVANVLNRAFNSSYTGADGKKLIAIDHVTLTGSQSNTLTTDADLSEASLEDMAINIMNATDAAGLRTLAAALAERGDFEDARLTAQRALRMAQTNGAAGELVEALRGDLSWYEQGKALPGGGQVK